MEYRFIEVMKTTTGRTSGAPRISAASIVFLLVLFHKFDLSDAVKDIQNRQPFPRKNINGDLQNDLPGGPDKITPVRDHFLNSNISGKEEEEDEGVGDDTGLAASLDVPHAGSEDEQDDFENDLGDDADYESLASFRWDIFDSDEDEVPFIDEDQVDSPEMMYHAEEETVSLSQMEIDFFDYVEGLEDYDTYDEQYVTLASEDLADKRVSSASLVSSTLSSPSAFSTECDRDVKGSKKKKKKRKNAQFQIMIMGKMGKGKLMSRWQKNCCIRGRRVGNARRTFLSNNLFQECKDRTRSLRSRMSRSCKWIFWSCCEAKALRRFYFFTKTRKKDPCP